MPIIQMKKSDTKKCLSTLLEVISLATRAKLGLKPKRLPCREQPLTLPQTAQFSRKISIIVSINRINLDFKKSLFVDTPPGLSN